MKEQSQIIAIAELDGWKLNPFGGMYPPNLQPETNLNQQFKIPNYLHSRDAIVPVIEKWITDEQSKWRFITKIADITGLDRLDSGEYHEVFYLLLVSPSQLCEALLRATGKWTEGKE